MEAKYLRAVVLLLILVKDVLSECLPKDMACNKPYCSSPQFIADPENCTNYYQCADFTWIHQTCGSSYFNADTCSCGDNQCQTPITCPSTTTVLSPPPAKDVYSPCLPVDMVCDRPPYCTPGDMIADPENCMNFYVCEDDYTWAPQSESCGVSYFKATTCSCGDDTCLTPITCPSTTTALTPPNDTCEEVESPCTVGEKYADQSDCEYYYECVAPLDDLVRRKCPGDENTPCPPDAQQGDGPCVFNITTKECTRPDAYFDCDLRCPSPTTVAPTVGETTESDDVVTTGAPQSTDATVPDLPETTTPDGGANGLIFGVEKLWTLLLVSIGARCIY